MYPPKRIRGHLQAFLAAHVDLGVTAGLVDVGWRRGRDLLGKSSAVSRRSYLAL
jgi:hypothetical protein